MDNLHELFGDAIASYSRAQALKDGILVNVSSVAQEAGLKFPLALTRAVWGAYVEVQPGVIGQDEAGRLWDIVYMLRVAIRRGMGGDSLRYQLHVRNDNRERIPPLVTLKAVCGPGDDAEPVLTVMLPDED